jgi:hypothetical protein
MEEITVTTFEQHVRLVSQLSPHGLILDWWRRLELAQREYWRAIRGMSEFRSRACEEQLALDPRLGHLLSARIRSLRLRRNAMAHGARGARHQEAASFAWQAFDALGQLSRAL